MFTEASKSSWFRTPFGNQRVNWFQALLKSALHHYYPIFQLIQDKMSWKKSALVLSQIFRLFIETLTPDDKYSCRNMQIFFQKFQTLLSQKEKIFSWSFIAFLTFPWNLEHSEKKGVSQPNYYGNYCMPKRSLVKRLKDLASENHSLINVLMSTKLC